MVISTAFVLQKAQATGFKNMALFSERGKTGVRKWIPLVTVVLIICLMFFLLSEYSNDANQSRIYQEWDYMRQPVSERLEKLKGQLAALEKEYQDGQLPKAVAQVLFTELDERVYDEAFPFLDEYGYTATLSLSPTELPGLEGCMTEEQFAELVDAGWSVCVRYDGTSVNDWWKALEPELEERGLTVPEAVYFPFGTYQSDMDRSLEQIGFKVVVSKVGEAESPIVLENAEGLWHLRAMGFMNADAKVRLNEAVEQKGNIVYCVGFTEEDEMFQTTAFSPMLNYFDQHRANGGLIVLNTDEAREHFNGGVTVDNPKLTKRYEKKKARIEEKIAEVTKELEELDNKYRELQ